MLANGCFMQALSAQSYREVKGDTRVEFFHEEMLIGYCMRVKG